MSLIETLVERRAHAWEQAKTLLDHAETEGRDLTGEESEQWDRINADLDGMDERIRQLDARNKANEAAEEMRSRYQPPAEGGPARNGAGGPTDQRTRDMLVLEELVSGKRKAVEFAPEKRDLTVGSATAGGNTVSTGFYGQLVEHMIENSAIRQTNVTVLTTEGGEDIQVPKTTTHPTASIVTEGAAISESDPVFGQITLGAFKYGFLTQVSAELEQDAGVDLIGYLTRIGGEALGNGSGAHFVTGTGSSQPNGVVTASTLGVTGGTGVAGVFTADNLIELFYSVIASYRRRGTWMMSDAGIRTARKLKGSDNNYLWQPGLQVGEPDLLLGRPVVSDTNVADPATSAKSVVFGDLSRYFIRDVAGVRIERSVDYAFANDLVTYRFLHRTDGDLIDLTGAVKHFIGAAT